MTSVIYFNTSDNCMGATLNTDGDIELGRDDAMLLLALIACVFGYGMIEDFLKIVR